MIRYEGNISYNNALWGGFCAGMFFGALKLKISFGDDIGGGVYLFGKKKRDLKQIAEDRMDHPRHDNNDDNSCKEDLTTKAVLKRWWETLKGKREAMRKVFRAVLEISDTKLRSRILKLLKSVFRQIMPRTVKGDFVFGLEDPYYTAKVLELFVLLYSKMGNDLRVKPVWDEMCFDGEVYCSGRIHITAVLWNVLGLMVNAEFSKIWRKYYGR